MSRKHRNKQRVRVRCLTFTVETITLIQQALSVFEQPLQWADHTNERVQFAEVTMQQVKAKLEAMKQFTQEVSLATFDYNEKIIITQALRMYILLLMSTPSNPQRSKELQQCQQIAGYLSNNKALV